MKLQQDLVEEDLQLMETVIESNKAEDGSTKLSKYCIEIARYNNEKLLPPFWGGFRSPLAQIKAHPKRFGYRYNDVNKTDCRIWVRNLSDNEDVISKHFDLGDAEINVPKEYAEKFNANNFIRYFSEDLYREWKEKAKLSDGMDNYEICKNIIYNRYLRGLNENKVIRIGNAIAFNTGETGPGGYDPYYLVFGEKSGKMNLNIYNRYEKSGRYLISLLNNKELSRVEFNIEAFDYTRPLEVEYGHIIEDHPEKHPEEFMAILKSRFRNDRLKDLTNREIVSEYKKAFIIQTMGAVEYMRKQLQHHSVTPVPFWYMKRDIPGWLVPLDFGLGESPNLALVVHPEELNGKPVYWGKTVISLKEAFVDARLLGKVTAEWLQYEKVFKVS